MVLKQVMVMPTAPVHGTGEHFEHIPASLPTQDSSPSFWHTEPSKFLLGHRTTAELPSTADVVIIGSGITGASAARYLLEGLGEEEKHGNQFIGRSVVMLEAREACWGATGRNGGHLQPIVLSRSPTIARFELKNCSEVASYITTNNIPCEYRAVTGCRTFWTKDLYQEASAQVAELKATEPDIGAVVSTIDGDARNVMEEHLVREGCKGVTLTQGAASLWPYKYVAWILEMLVKEKGLNLQTTTPVTKMTCDSPPELASQTSNDKSWTLHTPRGTITTGNVLLATNGYTTHLLPHLSDLLMPVRGTMSALYPPPELKQLIPNSYGFLANSPTHDPHADEYLTQRPYAGVHNAKGHLMYGGGREAGSLPTRNQSDDRPVDWDAVRFLQNSLPRSLILSEDQTPLEVDMAWSGIMGFSRDNCPWVGEVPGMSGVWLCGAYTGHGMPNATLCAKAVVEMIQLSTGDEMMMGAEAGVEVVKRGKLPGQYLFTGERMRRARLLPSIAEQDDSKVSCYLELPRGVETEPSRAR